MQHNIEFNGVIKSLAELARDHNMPYTTVSARFQRGWPIERLFKPATEVRGLVFITYKGETLSLTQWSKKLNISFFTIQDRHLSGLPPEKILYQGNLRKLCKVKKLKLELKKEKKGRRTALKVQAITPFKEPCPPSRLEYKAIIRRIQKDFEKNNRSYLYPEFHQTAQRIASQYKLAKKAIIRNIYKDFKLNNKVYLDPEFPNKTHMKIA